VDALTQFTPPGSTADFYCVGDLLIDTRTRQVTRDGNTLAIAGLSFDLLVVLTRAAPGLVSIGVLTDRVWKGTVVSPETVSQRIKILRQALGDTASESRYIEGRRGHGYRMAAAVTVPAPAPQAIAEMPLVPSPPANRPSRWIPALLAIALLLGAAGVWWALEHRSGSPTTQASGSRRESSPAPRASVAVMPFINLSGEPAKDYLGDGMAEELINTLAQVPGLKISARTSVFAYKGRNVDIRRIAQDLGVATILEGSVRSAGEHLRVSARLVDATSGYQIWSQDYDRQSADIFKLQDDLAGEIVQALRGYMKVALSAPPERIPPSTDVQAYQLYLQARSINRGTRTSVLRASALLDQALARDPDFAEALGDRAIIQAAGVVLGSAPAAALASAQRDTVRALMLSPHSAVANTAQELISALRGNWVEAENSFRAATASGASDPVMRSYHTAILLRPLGRLRQARAEQIETYRLAAADGFTMHELALTDSVLGLDADAVRLSGLSEEIAGVGAPPHTDVFLLRARAAARAGRYDEAAQLAAPVLPEPLRSAGGGQAIQAFYAALADSAKRPAALQALQGFVPTLKGSIIDGRTRMFFVDALAMTGALDAAYELAMWSADQRAAMPGIIDWSDVWMPEMRPFRQDARFQSFVTRLKLPDYWRVFGPPDECDLRNDTLICR
jgi:TolB-like protein/DNA-binding winged helix-turn-helix (wHTH) protein